MSPETAQRLTFATRTTLAALLAALVAFTVNLPQASTSMITVFIVSQPLAGMVLSKSLYRAMGTCVGAVVAVTLTAALNDQPELFALAASAWIGGCVAASIYLRDAPVAYAAMLSGYSVAIIAFPAVDTPDAVFQAALDRGSEIVVGIVCAATLSQIFFPQSAALTLRRATESTISSASAWAAETLRGRPDAARVARDRRALIAKLSTLDGLRIHATYDSAAVRLANRRIRLLHGRLVSFLALLVSIHDRLEIVRADSAERIGTLRPLLDAASDAMSPDASAAAREAARSALLAAPPSFAEMRADGGKLLERTILVRVADLVDLRGDLDILSRLDAHDEHDAERPETIARYRDHQLALVSGFAAFAALALLCGFWIASGWNAGSGAAIMLAVIMSLFAQQDDPSSAARVFFNMMIAGTVGAAFYVFVVLPRLETYEMLALVLAPALFVISYLMTIPRFALAALASAIGAISLLGLTNVMTPDFASFANNALAQQLGVGLGVSLLRVLRPVGAAWPIARLTAGVRSDIANTFAGRGPSNRIGFESRMFDRIQGLMTRLDLANPDQLALEQGALAGLRVGLNAMALRRVVRDLPDDVGRPLADALAEVARHFRRLARGEASAPPFERLDAALAAALAADPDSIEGGADLPVWISAVRTSLAQHPRMFGAAPDPAPAPAGGELRAAA